MKKILVGVGKPFSGKTLHFGALANSFQIPFVDMGAIFAEIIRQGGKKARIVLNYVGCGRFVPDNIVYQEYFNRVRYHLHQHYSCVGMPRTKIQLNRLAQFARSNGYGMEVFHINISETEAIKRRKASLESNDVARGNRVDDKKEAVFLERLERFNLETLPMINYAREMYNFHEVNGNLRSIEDVRQELLDITYGVLPQKKEESEKVNDEVDFASLQTA